MLNFNDGETKRETVSTLTMRRRKRSVGHGPDQQRSGILASASASISHEIDFNKTKSKVSRSEQKGSISAIELRPPTRIFSQCETLS